MGHVPMRHRSHHFAIQSSDFVARAEWWAKIASIEFWIPSCKAHGLHWAKPSCETVCVHATGIFRQKVDVVSFVNKFLATACFMQLSTPLNTALFSVQKSSQPQPLNHTERMRAARAAAPWTPSTDWLSRCCEPWKRDRSSSTQLPRVALCCEPLWWQQLKNSVLKVAWNWL